MKKLPCNNLRLLNTMQLQTDLITVVWALEPVVWCMEIKVSWEQTGSIFRDSKTLILSYSEQRQHPLEVS